LHELNDVQLSALLEDIKKAITIEGSILEKDRWTIWIARKKKSDPFTPMNSK